MIWLKSKFGKPKTIIWNMRVIDHIFMVCVVMIADSCEVKKILEIKEWNPKCAIIFIFKLDLLLCIFGPLIRFIWPIAFPFIEAPWISDLNQSFKITIIKSYSFDLKYWVCMSIHKASPESLFSLSYLRVDSRTHGEVVFRWVCLYHLVPEFFFIFLLLMEEKFSWWPSQRIKSLSTLTKFNLLVTAKDLCPCFFEN